MEKKHNKAFQNLQDNEALQIIKSQNWTPENYKVLYENEKNTSNTLRKTIKNHLDIFLNIKEHNWKLSKEQIKELDTYLWLNTQLGTMLEDFKKDKDPRDVRERFNDIANGRD